jgi:hypothetical protein
VDALGHSISQLPKHVWEPRRIPLGKFRGLALGLALHPQFDTEIYLEGAIARQAMLNRESKGPRAVLNAAVRLADGYPAECERIRQDLGLAERQRRDYGARLGRPFAHDAYLAELTALRDQLRAGLSNGSQEPGAEPVPVADLAARITTLKSAHAIDAAPERSGTHRARPATARRRQEPIPTAAARLAEPAEAVAVAVNGHARPANGPHTSRVIADETLEGRQSQVGQTVRQRSLF